MSRLAKLSMLGVGLGLGLAMTVQAQIPVKETTKKKKEIPLAQYDVVEWNQMIRLDKFSGVCFIENNSQKGVIHWEPIAWVNPVSERYWDYPRFIIKGKKTPVLMDTINGKSWYLTRLDRQGRKVWTFLPITAIGNRR